MEDYREIIIDIAFPWMKDFFVLLSKKETENNIEYLIFDKIPVLKFKKH